jgi:hypothetical protein
MHYAADQATKLLLTDMGFYGNLLPELQVYAVQYMKIRLGR